VPAEITGPRAAGPAPAANWSARPLLPAERAILAHPDQRTTWAPALHARLREPISLRAAQSRLDVLAVQHSIIGARLASDGWTVHPAPAIATFEGELAPLCDRFDLRAEGPLRVALSADGHELALASHHAALDGRALVAVARALVGGEPGFGRILRADDRDGESADAGRAARSAAVSGDGSDAAHASHPSPSRAGSTGAPASGARSPGGAAASGGGRGAMLRRLAQPADRVAPSPGGAAPEAFVSLEIAEGRRLRVAAVAAAAVAAVAVWNVEHEAPWRRIGLTIPVGGPDVIGNVSSHRRVDLRIGADVEAAVSAALGSAPPPDGGSALVGRLLAPLVDRFSDSLLVSNLGRIALPGAEAVDFYPQARGRSAVAIGAATVDGGARRLTLRARDLSADDARRLLALIAERLPPG
jgi:hypothetical protein